jgi:hypothetical protein
MTKKEFLNIIDSGDQELIKNHISDPVFKNFMQEVQNDFKQYQEDLKKQYQGEKDIEKKTIFNIVNENKNTKSNPKELKLNKNQNDYDFYLDTIDSFGENHKPEQVKGNVLVCYFNEDRMTLDVKGMYHDVKVINFDNEFVFVTDGETFNEIGDQEPAGSKTLEGVLKYLYDLNDITIDKNIFNTGADYFIIATLD